MSTIKIKDFFKEKTSEILNNFKNVKFDKNECQYAELIYDLVNEFNYINIDGSEELHIIT